MRDALITLGEIGMGLAGAACIIAGVVVLLIGWDRAVLPEETFRAKWGLPKH